MSKAIGFSTFSSAILEKAAREVSWNPEAFPQSLEAFKTKLFEFQGANCLGIGFLNGDSQCYDCNLVIDCALSVAKINRWAAEYAAAKFTKSTEVVRENTTLNNPPLSIESVHRVAQECLKGKKSESALEKDKVVVTYEQIPQAYISLVGDTLTCFCRTLTPSQKQKLSKVQFKGSKTSLFESGKTMSREFSSLQELENSLPKILATLL